MSRMLRVLSLFGFVFVITTGSVVVFWNTWFEQPRAHLSSTYVSPGQSYQAIVLRLVGRDHQVEQYVLRIYGRLTGISTKIKAGEYLFDSDDSYRSALEKMINGEVVTYQVALIEGKSLREVVDSLHQVPGLLRELPEGWHDRDVLDLLGIDGYASAEGLFFPDTYQYQKGMSELDVLRKAHTRMLRYLDKAWSAHSASKWLKNPYEALILASIVEKETGEPSERRAIAGVFIRRLEKGMRLQTDPTVIYGLGERFKGNLTRKHLREKTPYNTYTNYGLPPTPIALAGAAAIDAAMNPDRSTNALYFVARGDGTHYFSETLAEHNKAVKEYQLYKRKKVYRSSPQ